MCVHFDSLFLKECLTSSFLNGIYTVIFNYLYMYLFANLYINNAELSVLFCANKYSISIYMYTCIGSIVCIHPGHKHSCIDHTRTKISTYALTVCFINKYLLTIRPTDILDHLRNVQVQF